MPLPVGRGATRQVKVSGWEQIARRRAFRLTLQEDPFLRLRFAILAAMLLGAVGTGGFMLIEHFNPLDSMYMTVITLSTVGYETVHPLDAAGKVFAMGLIVFGIVIFTWVLGTVVEVFGSDQAMRLRERREMDKLVEGMSGHFIVCGYGRIGRQIVLQYRENHVPFVVVDMDSERIEQMRSDGIPFLEGDASVDEVLEEAGIHRAAGLIAVTPTDAVNTFIVLTARGVRSDLFIVARADYSHNVEKLYRAGASKVIAHHVLGGRWIGITAVNPAVTDFITAMTEMDRNRAVLREVTVDPSSGIPGQSFGEARLRNRSGALVVAIRSDNPAQDFHVNPSDDYVFQSYDVLVAIGSPKQIKHLATIVDPEHPLEPLAIGGIEA